MGIIYKNDIPYGGGSASSDTSVAQIETSTNANYEVLFSGTADSTTHTESARKASGLTYNPSTGALSVGKVTISSTPSANTDAATKQYVDNAISTNITAVLNASY